MHKTKHRLRESEYLCLSVLISQISWWEIWSHNYTCLLVGFNKLCSVFLFACLDQSIHARILNVFQHNVVVIQCVGFSFVSHKQIFDYFNESKKLFPTTFPRFIRIECFWAKKIWKFSLPHTFTWRCNIFLVKNFKIWMFVEAAVAADVASLL